MGAVEAPIEEASSQPAPTPEVVGTPTVQGPLQAPQQQQPKPEAPKPGTVWKDRVFHSSIDGDHLKVAFDRTGTKIDADEFHLENKGAGTAVGELEEGKYKFKSLKFTFTSVQEGSGLKVGDIATVTNGGFELLDQKTDQNKDGMNDKTGEALPLGLFGNWVQNKKTSKIDRYVPENKRNDDVPDSLEQFIEVVIRELPGIMRKVDKSVASKDIFEETVHAVVTYAWRQGIRDKAQLVAIITNAAHESGLNPNKQEDLYYVTPGQLRKTFGSDYFPTLDSEKPYLKNPEALANYVYGPAKRSDLGNTTATDGYTYRGRGLVQITGKVNYAKFTNLLAEIDFKLDGKHPDLVANPDLANHKEISVINLVLGMKFNLFRKPTKNEAVLDKVTEKNASASVFAGARKGLVGGVSVQDVGDIGKDLFDQVDDIDLTPDDTKSPPSNKEGFYTVAVPGLPNAVKVAKNQLSQQGYYPTTTDASKINWQPTSIATVRTAQALSEARGEQVKVGDRSRHTAAEFLASGADYADEYGRPLMSAGLHEVHTGWDLNVKGDENLNKPAFCAADGVIISRKWFGGFGNMVVVYHPQFNRWTRYAHLDSIDVQPGKLIKAGEQVGIIGGTGGNWSPHLHFDVIKDFESMDMWRVSNDYNKDGKITVQDRIDYVKDHFEDPEVFFSRVGVSIPRGG
jgi:predicted chitinase